MPTITLSLKDRTGDSNEIMCAEETLDIEELGEYIERLIHAVKRNNSRFTIGEKYLKNGTNEIKGTALNAELIEFTVKF